MLAVPSDHVVTEALPPIYQCLYPRLYFHVTVLQAYNERNTNYKILFFVTKRAESATIMAYIDTKLFNMVGNITNLKF